MSSLLKALVKTNWNPIDSRYRMQWTVLFVARLIAWNVFFPERFFAVGCKVMFQLIQIVQKVIFKPRKTIIVWTWKVGLIFISTLVGVWATANIVDGKPFVHHFQRVKGGSTAFEHMRSWMTVRIILQKLKRGKDIGSKELHSPSNIHFFPDLKG